MERIKKVFNILKKLYSKIWFKASLLIVGFLVFYAIREHVKLSDNTMTILNIVFIGVLLVLFYQRLYEKKISIIRFFLILLAMAVLNRFYDSNVFYTIFKINLFYAIFSIGMVIFFYIAGSKIWILIKDRKKRALQSENRANKYLKSLEDNRDLLFQPSDQNGNKNLKIKTNNGQYKEKPQGGESETLKIKDNVSLDYKKKKRRNKKNNAPKKPFSERIMDSIFLNNVCSLSRQ